METLAWPHLTRHVAPPRPPRGHAPACHVAPPRPPRGHAPTCHVALLGAPPGNAKVLASLHLCFLPY